MCNPRDHQSEQTAAMLLARAILEQLYIIIGPAENRGNIAEAILADALGLPGRGEYNQRVSRHFAEFDPSQLAQHVRVMQVLLALARGYVGYRNYQPRRRWWQRHPF